MDVVRIRCGGADHADDHNLRSVNPIRIFVPYTHVKPATLDALWKYARLQSLGGPFGPLAKINFIDVCRPNAYLDYLQERWDKCQTFINVEHDVVPWPGAIEELWECEHDWCAHYYMLTPTEGCNYDGPPPFGCVKFSSAFMLETVDVWEDHRPARAEWVEQFGPDDGGWRYLDLWLHEYATAAGLKPHIHWPGVVNVQNNISLVPGPDGEPIEIVGEQ